MVHFYLGFVSCLFRTRTTEENKRPFLEFLGMYISCIYNKHEATLCKSKNQPIWLAMSSCVMCKIQFSDILPCINNQSWLELIESLCCYAIYTYLFMKLCLCL
ncbi:unnamed protein product [Musa textilis]